MLVRSFTGLIVLSMWVGEYGVEIYDDIDDGIIHQDIYIFFHRLHVSLEYNAIL